MYLCTYTPTHTAATDKEVQVLDLVKIIFSPCSKIIQLKSLQLFIHFHGVTLHLHRFKWNQKLPKKPQLIDLTLRTYFDSGMWEGKQWLLKNWSHKNCFHFTCSIFNDMNAPYGYFLSHKILVWNRIVIIPTYTKKHNYFNKSMACKFILSAANPALCSKILLQENFRWLESMANLLWCLQQQHPNYEGICHIQVNTDRKIPSFH